MILHTIDNGNFKLDGGAMFGVVPKSIWERSYPADDRNLCPLAMRSLLIETGSRLILVDTGIGNKQDEKFFSYYHLHGEGSAERSLAALGFIRKDITDVLLTHLHLDHAGGAVVRESDKLSPTYPRAVYHVHQAQWNWAMQPNPREAASFLKENILPLRESGQLAFLEPDSLPPEIEILVQHGHTEALVLPRISYKGKKILFAGDLFPTMTHLPVPYVAGYDVFPLTAMEEKARLLEESWTNGDILLFQHDAITECCSLRKTEKGIRHADTFDLSEL
jgi:glyoxylase-like metal-dependent hydrolase (beta-lactamase superfamily II)